MDKALFSSATDEWETPQLVFDALDLEFGFTLDPCCTHRNAKCSLHFTKEENGLIQDWADHVVFVNPPYGRTISDWIKKAYESAQKGAVCVCLIPARSCTRWWHRYCMKGEIRFLRGRIKFVGGKHSAPFPSAVVIFRPPQFKIESVDLKKPSDQRTLSDSFD